METREFTEAMKKEIEAIRNTATEAFNGSEEQLLNHKEHPEKWSVLECLEHLNRYHQYYYPHLKRAFSQPSDKQPSLRTSWTGQKFIKMMLPENKKKMKALKHMNPQLTPAQSRLDKKVFTAFLNNQEELFQLVADLPQANLNKKCIPVEFFKLLKMRSWEAFHFLIAHEQRHLAQAIKAISVAERNMVRS